jgi:hypothetical protein
MKVFLELQSFQVIDWLGNSPDLNPREDLLESYEEPAEEKGHITDPQADRGDQGAVDPRS